MVKPILHIHIYCLECKRDLETYVEEFSMLHQQIEKIEKEISNHLQNNHFISEGADASSSG